NSGVCAREFMAAAIEFENVSKRFILHHERPRSFQELAMSFLKRNNASREELWALKDISFAMERGETLGIIGPNGSGKSTLLKLITRILEPTSGRIAVNGKVSALLELGAGFHPDLTGRENIFLNGSILGMSRREMEGKFEQIVEFTELGRFIDTPLKHYSSGMQMRLGFAIATSVDPDILLIDEVLAVGDAAFQRKCLKRIAEFKRRGKTIVFVSHDLGAVRELCSEVIWLEEGQVQAGGLAREVVDRYLMRVHEKERADLAAQQTPPAETLPDEEPSKEMPAEGVKKRWGTREIEITSVRLLNSAGEETFLFESGQPAAIEIGYRVNHPAEAPVFGIGIYRDDGTYCYGTNTDIEGLSTDDLEGVGVVRVAFDSFAFIEGTYTLDVAVHARDGYSYDYHRPYCTFAVRSRLKDGGVFRPRHRWEISSRFLG
ncbi:MAG: ABC transporter ATP-binding protein, partial [Chloroflexota bacterium]|nr:ABC transporter ATP-binding protein [Chloroflexota bacterium]